MTRKNNQDILAFFATGKLGRIVMRSLLEKDYNVTIFSRNNNPDELSILENLGANIYLSNFDDINNATSGLWMLDPSLLESYVNNETISSIELSRYGCRVGSFASLPYFIIDFNQSDTSAVRILSYALESDKLGLEPFDDDNQNEVRDANEKFFDYNLNELYDSTLINTFYDTTDVFKLWKGPYLRDNKNCNRRF